MGFMIRASQTGFCIIAQNDRTRRSFGKADQSVKVGRGNFSVRVIKPWNVLQEVVMSSVVKMPLSSGGSVSIIRALPFISF